jgi:hypothetical protein
MEGSKNPLGFDLLPVISFLRFWLRNGDMQQPGFFNVKERLVRLNGLGDQFEAFSRTVEF